MGLINSLKSNFVVCLIACVLFINNTINAQTNIFIDNFETGAFSASWTVVNDVTNQWFVGTAAKQAGKMCIRDS